MGKGKVWPSADPKPLNRSSPNLNGMITLWTPTTKKFGLNPPRDFCSPYRWNICQFSSVTSLCKGFWCAGADSKCWWAVSDDVSGPCWILGRCHDTSRPRPTHVCWDRAAQTERLGRTLSARGRLNSAPSHQWQEQQTSSTVVLP